ncbi:Predicted acetyltransferase [Quadrisphaera granulorum]|uniref:Putative acetyltransferase n=1 Tax=Quadrisphaera granulorum TaxID=317664 RepID=A0A315ZP68_9ACTN|nr:GNAT family N-acetyltransferase [Quadrisphaera granulorum]PWJ47361.1 putative acetyltransferase [Quadrisphaera granulorum]SZE98808.1 Predicted acetyltransferase [Quadrisphaera granulorum]
MSSEQQVEIRAVTEGEQLEWLRCSRRTFLYPKTVTAEHVEHRRPTWEGQRLTGAFDGDRVVGTYRSWEWSLPVPGGAGHSVLTDHISTVTVAPTHRRRGILTRMITADLSAARERGVPLAYLVAGEAPIYGRYGFGAAVAGQTLTVRVPASLAHVPTGTEGIRVELVDDADLRAEAPVLFAAVAAARPGAVLRTERFWDEALGLAPGPGDDATAARPALIARDASGAAVGVARYRAQESWQAMRHDTTLEVHDVFAATPAAQAALWQHLLSMDIVDRLRITERPLDDPLPELLADRRDALAGEGSDHLWARLLDVPAALEARGWLGPAGSCVLEVHDALGIAGGRWRLDVADGLATVTTTTADADVTCDVGALSAAYLGETSLVALAAAGRVRGDAAAVGRLSAQLAWQPTSWPTIGHF